jgi:hypothetical protein
MSTHTPAPWAIHKSKFTFAIQSTAEPHAGLIAHVYAKGEPSADEVGFSRPEEAEANAKLIAAAPDLLRAAKDVVKAWENGDLAAAVRWLSATVAEAEKS